MDEDKEVPYENDMASLGAGVNIDKTEDGVYDIYRIDLKIYNTPGVALPSTGGKGTAAFLISGLTLALTSGAVLTSRRSKSRTSAGKKDQ